MGEGEEEMVEDIGKRGKDMRRRILGRRGKENRKNRRRRGEEKSIV